MSEQAYSDKFASIHEYLLSGDCYQINLAQRWKARYQAVSGTRIRSLSKSMARPFLPLSA
ncbi:hypothetical protein JCM19233_3176 [Vibrio astriarenae]|nr:hypothetical protein JCM19233_3176 [Vibrio sp. C7]